MTQPNGPRFLKKVEQSIQFYAIILATERVISSAGTEVTRPDHKLEILKCSGIINSLLDEKKKKTTESNSEIERFVYPLVN